MLDETHFVEHAKSGYATNFSVTACEPLRRWSFAMENGAASAKAAARYVTGANRAGGVGMALERYLAAP